MPIEPPICWDVLTMAEAMPASFGATPSVAAENAGREEAAHPDADDEQAGQDAGAVAGGGRQLGEQEHRDHPERHAEEHQRFDAGAFDHAGLDRRSR